MEGKEAGPDERYRPDRGEEELRWMRDAIRDLTKRVMELEDRLEKLERRAEGELGG